MKRMSYNKIGDYFGEARTFAPMTKKKEEAYPFNIDIDFEKYERTKVKRTVLGYASKQD